MFVSSKRLRLIEDKVDRLDRADDRRSMGVSGCRSGVESLQMTIDRLLDYMGLYQTEQPHQIVIRKKSKSTKSK